MMYILLFVYICSEFRIYFFDYCFLAILARPHLFFVFFGVGVSTFRCRGRHTGAHTFGARRDTWVKTSIE